MDKSELYSNLEGLPFRINISFEKVISYWKEKANDKTSAEHPRALRVMEMLDRTPAIAETFQDLEILETYKDEIGLLLSHIFPEILTKNEIKSGSVPFLPIFFNPSQRFSEILGNAGDDYEFMIRDYDYEKIYRIAGSFYLTVMYGVKQRYKEPIFFDIPDARTGMTRHYRAFFNGDFSSFKENEKFKPLSQEDIEMLINNFDNTDLWREKIPPQSIDFEGFGIVTMFDVTADQALSELKNKLLQKDVLHTPESILELQENVINYMEIEDLTLGLASYDHEAKQVKTIGGSNLASKFLKDREQIERRECFCNHSIEELFKQKRKMVVSNLDNVPAEVSPLISSLQAGSVKSAILAPLVYGEEVIGVLELTCPVADELNPMLADKLDALIPLFTVAVKRAMDEYETNLEAIIQEKFTSIHQSVSWKFFESAEKVLSARRAGISLEPDDIVFKDVVPLFGQFDIRGSSSARNAAIQADLVEQLTLTEEVVNEALEEEKLPIYRLLKHRINKYRNGLINEINAGDEVKILDFLNQEVYPVFNHIKENSDRAHKAVDQYMQTIDPVLHVIYKKRKSYEDTVTMINDKIADYLEKQQELAQQMFPHYFERYKTDGVEYNIYIGESLLKAREYNELYLHNLRLWQLLVTCGVENLIYQSKDEFPTHLEIASLILAHNNPLSIKFRMDEKQFDVDGAYNIRYEIMKKRIDKAYIKGTQERLTQPGYISIVYSQEEEAMEYKRYLEYLQSIGYLSSEVEDLELQDLQGTTGLRALRVKIVYEQGEDVAIRELIESTMVPQ